MSNALKLINGYGIVGTLISIKQNFMNRFNYAICQPGNIEVKPDGRTISSLERQSSSVLIWPEGQSPSAENTILTDPCFTANGYAHALRVLSDYGLSLDAIGQVFITHQHADHTPCLPKGIPKQSFRRFDPEDEKWASGIRTFSCPGHSPDSQSLIFQIPSRDNVWIVGDAILNEEWLLAWQFFWPNVYTRAEIVQTWRSVAIIVANADVIIPGHGAPFSVSASLVEKLLFNFPKAKYSAQCSEVTQVLHNRLLELRAR